MSLNHSQDDLNLPKIFRKERLRYARQSVPVPQTLTAYNAANQLTNWKGLPQSYDLNGNLVNDGVKTYTWNARNQLVALSGSGVTASFQYDAQGRRTGKTVNGISTNFLYDGLNVIQELTGTTPKANLLPGLNLDEVFARAEGGNTSYYLTDALNSTLALTDVAGTLQTQYTYEPFGNTKQSGAANSNSYQYTGRENDGTGLMYYRARYYSPTQQRFISQDPIGFAGGDVNLYAYVKNNPVNFTDPLGLLVVAMRVEVSDLFYVIRNTDGKISEEGLYRINNAKCYFLCFFQDDEWDQLKKEMVERETGEPSALACK